MIYGRKIIGTVGYMGGVPAVLEQFCWAWGQLIQFNSEYLCENGQRVNYVKSKQSFHSIARNDLVRQTVGDWLLMIDTDHNFEPDICLRLVRLMQTFELDVVGAMYYHKDEPHVPIVFKHEASKKGMLNLGSWPQDLRVFHADSIGAGSLLVKRSVFKRIKKELGEDPFDIIPPYGEDHSFFLRCEKLNILGWCAPIVESGHMTVKTVTSADYQYEELGAVEGVFTTAQAVGYQWR